jgi:Potential Queuosine, Q, salvage protein family
MITELIRSTSNYISEHSQHVTINSQALQQLVDKIKDKPVYINFFEYSEHIDITEDDEALISYAFVLDALNFCFWGHDWEYGDLARNIKEAHKRNPKFLTPEFLANISLEEVKNEIFAGENFPLLEERMRALNEIGTKTVSKFEGKFSNILKAANFDA